VLLHVRTVEQVTWRGLVDYRAEFKRKNVFDLPQCMLHTKVTGNTEMGSRSGCPAVLSLDQQRELVECAVNRASPGIRFGKRSFLQYAK